MTLSTHIPLRDGAGTMPTLGLGTWQLQDAASLVASALRAGYRHLDTARFYGTERAVGEGIRASGIDRSEVFVTTKVWHEDLGAAAFARSIEASLSALQTPYVDLLLVHWPSSTRVPLAETMRALANARHSGLARHVGVANFNVRMLEEAIGLCSEPVSVLQAEYHPELDQSTLLAACRRNGVVFTAYCPLGRGRVFENDVLKVLAARKGRSVAQVVLRWLLQQGVAAVPKSGSPNHVASNLQVYDFELTPDEAAAIDTLRRTDGRIVDPPFAPKWD